jgi:hypothetical protein
MFGHKQPRNFFLTNFFGFDNSSAFKFECQIICCGISMREHNKDRLIQNPAMSVHKISLNAS